ncbi:MAG: helix-turn-helix transcriptional regulator [Treponema sp.]|jgi:AraC-like DNA-binding protein|nr:helix-turn-helix transcriptional regulator [Treponema sp.]
MLFRESIKTYKGSLLSGDKNCLYIPPHEMLQPFIANYTISFPSPQNMPDEYTILPTASSTIVITVNSGEINGSLRGVNTKALNVGNHINKLNLLLLIEFHTGGLYPFLSVEQSELVDASFALNELDKKLMKTLKFELEKSSMIETLVEALDKIFISRLMNLKTMFDFSPVMRNIIKRHGIVNMNDASLPFFYSERQTRRLFLRYVGINPKKLTRIVRANYALRLIKNGKDSFLDVTEETGYFDQPHFIHEFKMIHGITPQEYKQKMSVFYNDNTKM